MRYIIYILLIAAIHNASFAQIVNTESQRIQSDTTGWLGNIGTSFLFEKNVIQVIDIGATAHVEYKSKESLYLLLVNYDFLRGDGQTLNNSFFYHVRYNYKLNKWLRWEVFTQLQQNRINGIELRFLAGTGPRFKLANNKKVSLYAATAAMYEYEKEETVPVVYHWQIRSSSYLSFTWNPAKTTEIVSTLFYQPLYSDFKDYRILNEISLKLKLAKHFSFNAGWYYLFDSRPVATIPKLNYSISNGITYQF